MAAKDPEKSGVYYDNLYEQISQLVDDDVVETSTSIADTLTALATERDAH